MQSNIKQNKPVNPFRKWLNRVLSVIRAWVMHYNFKHACKIANEMRARTHKKHVVFKMNGKFVVIERQRVKQLQREGYFKRGLNLKEVEAAALYTTY